MNKRTSEFGQSTQDDSEDEGKTVNVMLRKAQSDF